MNAYLHQLETIFLLGQVRIWVSLIKIKSTCFLLLIYDESSDESEKEVIKDIRLCLAHLWCLYVLFRSLLLLVRRVNPFKRLIEIGSAMKDFILNWNKIRWKVVYTSVNYLVLQFYYRFCVSLIEWLLNKLYTFQGVFLIDTWWWDRYKYKTLNNLVLQFNLPLMCIKRLLSSTTNRLIKYMLHVNVETLYVCLKV